MKFWKIAKQKLWNRPENDFAKKEKRARWRGATSVKTTEATSKAPAPTFADKNLQLGMSEQKFLGIQNVPNIVAIISSDLPLIICIFIISRMHQQHMLCKMLFTTVFFFARCRLLLQSGQNDVFTKLQIRCWMHNASWFRGFRLCWLAESVSSGLSETAALFFLRFYANSLITWRGGAKWFVRFVSCTWKVFFSSFSTHIMSMNMMLNTLDATLQLLVLCW